MSSGISAMSGSLDQMRAMAAQAAGKTGLDNSVGGSDAVSGADSGSFASMLQASLAKVSQAQDKSVAQAHAFETGSSDVSLSDVMIDMQKANIQFQTAVQVRNKLVSAYSDIMQMQV